MRIYCTVSDSNFLPYGLALHKSLKTHSDKFQLYYLCTDTEAYNILTALALPDLIPVFLEDLKAEDPVLAGAANLPPSYEALNVGSRTNIDPKQVQFFWCLTAYFTWHTLNRDDVDEVLYIDADICFFGDVKTVFAEIGDKSIGIVRHRIPYNPAVGEYNVGIVYFRKTLKGYQCSDWWKTCLLHPTNPHYKTHGICGDQKYLELFEPLFKDVCVVDKTVGHLAPWNYRNHGYTDDSILWNGTEQPLIYIHFSNFKPDYENNTYEIAPRHGLNKGNIHPFVKDKYDEYFNLTKKMRDLP